ncbi:MAG TPA: alkaline phosphatase family protein, partial [Chloroflexota bacterium]|nr:alkaline phosphatase family protein [Chloroflexota bacterium]
MRNGRTVAFRTVLGILFAVGVLVLGASVAFGSRPSRAVGACTQKPCGPIKHIVIIVRENHSYDNLFGLYPAGDGTKWAWERKTHHRMGETPDVVHSDILGNSAATRFAIDGGKMDLFYRIAGAVSHGQDIGDSEYGPAQMANYWTYARRFSLADHFFSTIGSQSFPNHLVL